uniref:Uncharacterized protein n=1 Tax=Sphaerodactylus townsendi TaxID=933632 RepID=A0ACB8EZ43_9SAUR
MAGPLRWLRQLPPLLHYSALGMARSSLQAAQNMRGPVLNDCSQNKTWQMLQARHLAAKKTKVKGKGQARVNINTALVEDIINLEEVNEEMQAVVEALKEEFGKNVSIRTSPGALDHIVVTTEDGKFPLNQLGQVSLKPPQLILVNMSNFPESTAAAIKAIRESGMDLNPEADGPIIRVPIPKVTREHREKLTTLPNSSPTSAGASPYESSQVKAINQTAKKAKSTVSEDTIKLIEKQIQQMTDDTSDEMDRLLAAKTKDLLG